MNDAELVWVSVGVSVALVLAGFVAAARVGRLVPMAVGTLTIALVGWLVDVAAIGYGWGNAGGFVDCRDSCTGMHYAAAAAFVGGPLFFVLGVGALVVGQILLRRPGHRRDPKPR